MKGKYIQVNKSDMMRALNNLSDNAMKLFSAFGCETNNFNYDLDVLCCKLKLTKDEFNVAINELVVNEFVTKISDNHFELNY